jgi:phage shock protein A
MSLTTRLANLWRGFASLWISGAERKHPEIAYENAIEGMLTKYAQLKSATAAIIRRREDLEARLLDRSRELHQVAADLDTAVATEQDDLALALIQKKDALEADVAGVKGDLDAAVKDAEAAKASLVHVQGEIRKLRAEKDAMLARLKSAQARLRIQEQLEGISLDAEVRALENVREHVRNTVAEANLSKELADTSLEQRLAGLRQQTGDASAKAQLEALKAARAAGASAAKKTL